MAKNKKAVRGKKGEGSLFSKRKVMTGAIVLLALFIGITIIHSVIDRQKRIYTGLRDAVEEESYPLSELDSDAFFVDEYYFRSYDDGEITSKRGIDVSEHQSEIDWKSVKESGVEFAFIRAGFRTYDQGNLKTDARFYENIKGAKENGIEVGIYFFSQAISVEEAIEEARYAVSLVEGYELDLPIAFDMEEVTRFSDRINGLDYEERTEFADAFCQVVENYGYDSMIYGNPSWLLGKINLLQLADRKIWLANYTEDTLYPFRFDIWQYSEEGNVDGIDVPVDLNIMFIRNN